MYLAQNLKYLREQKGMEQQEIADMMEVEHETISSWECGIRTPDIEAIVKLAKYYGVSLDDLVLKDMRPPVPNYIYNLIYLRHSRGITQEDIAKILKFKNKSSYCLIESGKTKLATDDLIKLANYFDISLDDLVYKDLRKR